MSPLIEKIAAERLVENLIGRLRVTQSEARFDLDDLTQDIYVSLMDKDEELIAGLYERGELEYYILRMVVNQVCSKTSPYYTQYKKNLPVDPELKDEGEEINFNFRIT